MFSLFLIAMQIILYDILLFIISQKYFLLVKSEIWFTLMQRFNFHSKKMFFEMSEIWQSPNNFMVLPYNSIEMKLIWWGNPRVPSASILNSMRKSKMLGVWGFFLHGYIYITSALTPSEGFVNGVASLTQQSIKVYELDRIWDDSLSQILPHKGTFLVAITTWWFQHHRGP